MSLLTQRHFALQHIADLIGADAKDIVFTSGATESNNMAIKGIARFYKGKKRHMSVVFSPLKELLPADPARSYSITTQTEHKCVLDSCRVLQDEGFDVTYLPVKENGLIDLKQLEEAIRPDTCLVSVRHCLFFSLLAVFAHRRARPQIMLVNNEIGTIQPIKEIGEIVKKHKGVFFHTDAAQGVGKGELPSSLPLISPLSLNLTKFRCPVPINVNDLKVDVLSISGHKIYGPKGVGCLYVRRKPRVRLEPIISGGGQERGLRSGTVPVPLAVGFGEACRLAKKEMAVSWSSFGVARLSLRPSAKTTPSNHKLSPPPGTSYPFSSRRGIEDIALMAETSAAAGSLFFCGRARFGGAESLVQGF